MNSITKEFKKAVEELYDETVSAIKNSRAGGMLVSSKLYDIRDQSKKNIIEQWAKEGKDMSEVDFDVELDVDLNL